MTSRNFQTENNTNFASEWVDGDERAVLDDLNATGLKEAAAWQVELADDQENWAGKFTAAEMEAELTERWPRLSQCEPKSHTEVGGSLFANEREALVGMLGLVCFGHEEQMWGDVTPDDAREFCEDSFRADKDWHVATLLNMDDDEFDAVMDDAIDASFED